MEMERRELEAIREKKHAIVGKATLLEKGIKILDPE
jgi:hypothetical protein